MVQGFINRNRLLAALSGSALLFQTGCTIGQVVTDLEQSISVGLGVDPDIVFRGFFQFLTETGVFILDNLVVGLR